VPAVSVLCSAHPGHLHSTPHVHPEPASKDISLMDGMEGKSGIEGGKGEEGDNRMGARSGPGVEAKIFIFFFLPFAKGNVGRRWRP